MTKKEFLAALRRRLHAVPQAELRERLGFYSEIIDDKMEEGLTEGEAVADVGNVDEIAEQILTEVEIPKAKAKAPASPWQIVLLIIGSPVWLPILISVYAVMWSVVITLWAVEIPMFIFSMISKGLIIACTEVTKFTAKLTQMTASAIGNLFRR